MEINHQPFYDETTSQKWSVRYYYDEKFYRNIVIDVLEFPQSNAPEVQPTYKLFCKLNSIFQHLHLRLDNDGNVSSLVNKEEIEVRWECVKKEILSEYAGINPVKKMVEKLNFTYYSCKETIMQSLLHLVLLACYRDEEKFVVRLPSVLNEGELIYTDVKRILSDSDKLYFHGEGCVHNISAMKKAYDKQIKPLTQSDFNYAYTIDVKYIFKSEHTIQKIEACIREQSSNRFVYKKTVTFSLIPKE